MSHTDGYPDFCPAGFGAFQKMKIFDEVTKTTFDSISGENCTDVDECSIDNDCDVLAECTNTVGSYKCKCKQGYVGDGFTW